MNQLGMYSFYDKEAKVYTTPFFAKSDLFARRHWLIQMEDGNSMLRRFVDQYDLVRVGTFDVRTGLLDYANIEKDGEEEMEQHYVVLKGINIGKEFYGGSENGEKT